MDPRSWIVGKHDHNHFHCLLLLTLASKYTNSLEILRKNNPRIPSIQRFYTYYYWWLVQEILGTSIRRRVYLQISVLTVRRELFAHCPGLWVTTVATLHSLHSARWRRRAKHEFKYVCSVVWEGSRVSGSMACWSSADTSQSCPPVCWLPATQGEVATKFVVIFTTSMNLYLHMCFFLVKRAY